MTLCAESVCLIAMRGWKGRPGLGMSLPTRLLRADKPLNWIGSLGRDGSGACSQGPPVSLWPFSVPPGRASPLEGRGGGGSGRAGLGDDGSAAWATPPRGGGVAWPPEPCTDETEPDCRRGVYVA